MSSPKEFKGVFWVPLVSHATCRCRKAVMPGAAGAGSSFGARMVPGGGPDVDGSPDPEDVVPVSESVKVIGGCRRVGRPVRVRACSSTP